MTGDSPIIRPMDGVGQRLAQDLSLRGLNAEFVVRAPGRVNLIGEHIDYNGYAVLPMALEQAVHIAVTRGPDGMLQLTNTDPAYESTSVPLIEALEFGSTGPPSSIQWFHYILCAVRGIADFMKSKSMPWSPPNLALHVGGSDYGGLFPAAGLSSSSALVVATALALIHATQLEISRHELAGLCARCERYIGMQGGGMDQAASLLGVENNAIMIEFTKPLVTIHTVPLPVNVLFVIAHSGVHARKAATSMYNERVSECRLASRLLISKSPYPDLVSGLEAPCLADAQHAWNLRRPGDMLTSCRGVKSIVDRFLPDGIVTRSDLLELMTEEELESCLTPTTKHMESFRLKSRAEHVYSEAERTLTFHDLCKSLTGCGDVTPENTSRLASLMNDSQNSCAQLYQCSCPELDELVSVCRSAGALGCRLTGAGWGGCTVSLVEKEKAAKFIAAVKKEYYLKRGMSNDVDRLIFISKPGPPACVMQPVDPLHVL